MIVNLLIYEIDVPVHRTEETPQLVYKKLRSNIYLTKSNLVILIQLTTLLNS